MVCDRCKQVAIEESVGFGLTPEQVVEVMVELGEDLPDHDCEAALTEGEVECSCGCSGSK